MSNVTPLRSLPFQAKAEEPEPRQAKDPGDTELWSVTSIIRSVGTDDGLIHWSAQQAARAALDEGEVWQPMARRRRDDAYAWLANARNRPLPGRKLMPTEIGQAFHECAEAWVVSGERQHHEDPDVERLLDSFGAWLDRFQPQFEAAELTVYHPLFGYAGTLDGIGGVDGARYVIDYKTSVESWDTKGKRRKPYPSVVMQLAAYRWAEFAAVWHARRTERWNRRLYLLSAHERSMAVPMPQVDGGLVVYVTPDYVDTYTVDCGAEAFEQGFLVACHAFNWLHRDRDFLSDHPDQLPTRRP